MINRISGIIEEHFISILLLAVGVFVCVGFYASWKERIECQTKLAQKNIAVQDIKKLCS